MTDIEVLLSSEVGNHSKIREFRSRLTPGERELFDKIFLLGCGEGLLLNVQNGVDCLNGKVVSLDSACNGCSFWDTPSYPGHCRIGIKPEVDGWCIFKRDEHEG